VLQRLSFVSSSIVVPPQIWPVALGFAQAKSDLGAHEVIDLVALHSNEPMQRSRESPRTVWSLSLDDPARCLVAWHSAQPALSKDALESRKVTACERPRVPDLALNLGHSHPCFASHFLVQA
jgi:hypothetical protein